MPRPASLPLDLLRTFVFLLDRTQGDAAEAAKVLQVNQPSMSKRLATLQHAGKVIKQPWLVRLGKTWKATDAGQRLLPAVREIVRRYDQLMQSLEKPTATAVRVTFACGRESAGGFVRQAVHAFRAEHPDVRLQLATLRGRERIERVANGSLDLATVTHREHDLQEIAHRPLHSEALLQDRLVLICAEQAAWSRQVKRLPRDRVEPEQLLGLPLILPEANAGVRPEFDEVFRKRGLLGKRDVALEVGGWAAILDYVREGVGVGVVSDGALRERHGLIVRPLAEEVFPPIVTHLICRRTAGTGKDLDLTPEASTFAEALRRAARENGNERSG